MTIPPIPVDFAQLAQWLIMPSVLALIASLVITDFFATASAKAQTLVKLVTYLVIAFVSFGLTKLAPDFVASIEPLWAILAGVIAAYYAPVVVVQAWRGGQLLGMRLIMGRDSFNKTYSARFIDAAAAHG